MAAKILVPINDSPTAQKTIESIIENRDRFSEKLTLLYVFNKEQFAYKMIPDIEIELVLENGTRAGNHLLQKADDKLSAVGFKNELLLEFGEPRSTICSIANENEYQLVVIGRHEGSGALRDVIFGSVANYVLHNVRCPVLLF